MKRNLLKALSYITIAALVTSLTGCDTKKPKDENVDLTLEVALYQYVPDMTRFQEVVRNVWEREHPGAELHFVDWDCYVSAPDKTLDVFVFDGIYLTSFAEKGLLLQIPSDKIQSKEGYIPFALEGCTCGEDFYALPQLLCTDLLYTRKSDSALSGISDTAALYDILGSRKNDSIIPDENEGLLINLSDELFTKTMMYLDALMDERGEYTDYGELPDISNISDEVLGRINEIWEMGGEEQVRYWPEDNDAFIRARWFADGKGRAYIGYSEAMSAMGDYADDVDVRIFSYGSEKNIPLFYTDMVGISSEIDENKKELAFELANVLTCEEVLTGINTPAKESGTPQYLLVSRGSVYDALSEDYPIYGLLGEIACSADNRVFRMGGEAGQYVTDMEKALADHSPF